jgi:hypothetical protein
MATTPLSDRATKTAATEVRPKPYRSNSAVWLAGLVFLDRLDFAGDTVVRRIRLRLEQSDAADTALPTRRGASSPSGPAIACDSTTTPSRGCGILPCLCHHSNLSRVGASRDPRAVHSGGKHGAPSVRCEVDAPQWHRISPIITPKHPRIDEPMTQSRTLRLPSGKDVLARNSGDSRAAPLRRPTLPAPQWSSPVNECNRVIARHRVVQPQLHRFAVPPLRGVPKPRALGGPHVGAHQGVGTDSCGYQRERGGALVGAGGWNC